MNSAVIALKRALRKDIKNRLRAVSPDVIAAESEKVAARLFDLDEYKSCKNVSVYISMPSGEIDTRNIIQHILHSEKNCYVPRWTADAMEMVKIASWEDYLSLPVNKWNIPEPPHDRVMENALDTEGLDLVIVPAMAFDEERNRIGHGKGYYDKYILASRAWADERRRSPPRTVGLALSAQILDRGRIPVEPTDQKIDYIVTPSKIIQ